MLCNFFFFLFICFLLFLFFCSQLYTHSFSFGTRIYYFPLLSNWNNSKVLGKMAHVILEPGSVNNFPRTFSVLKPPTNSVNQDDEPWLQLWVLSSLVTDVYLLDQNPILLMSAKWEKVSPPNSFVKKGFLGTF